ncbi:hypothetical protein V495_05270 [Pseudogymnoascus sp. VKM F-4514 (FW-929)]|nr:hypothetical protein V495_05270 [Pseudogymnoascus sp. VKM F-4514 (FW-929)]KFY57030.1 hypothetical protein V497_05798 [Pseudogymnoascus sp. VKM F-4516 (FW-969)]
MTDDDSYAATPVDTDRSVKRRRLSSDDTATPRYSSPDELAANGDEHHQTSRRDSRLNTSKGNASRRKAAAESSHERSPSHDELAHTFYADEEDIERGRDHESPSESISPSQTPSSTEINEDNEGADVKNGGEQLPQVRYKLKYELDGHERGISQVAFSPDGQWIASASADATIKIWEASTGNLSHELKGHLAGISTVSWSPDSLTLASGSDDKTIRLWDVTTGKPYPKPWKGHHNYVYSIAFSPKGNVLVSGSFDEAVFLWDVRAGRQMRSLPAHSDPVAGVDCIRDGTLVVSCAGDGLIRIWDTASGQCLRTIVHEDNAGVVSVKFSPNGKHVLAWTLDGCIRLWDYVTGLCKKTYQGHVNSRYSISGAFGVYGSRAFIVSGSEDGKIVFWDTKSKEILQKLDAHDGVVLSVDTHPESGRIVSCGVDNKIKVWVNEGDDEEASKSLLNGSGQQLGPNSEDSPTRMGGYVDDDAAKDAVNENGANTNGLADADAGEHITAEESMDAGVKVEDDTLQELPSRPKDELL